MLLERQAEWKKVGPAKARPLLRKNYSILAPTTEAKTIGRISTLFKYISKHSTPKIQRKATFVRNSLMLKNLPTDKSFYLLPEKLEKGQISVIDLPKSLPPVGTTGELLEVYADQDIRILRGKSPTFKKVALLIMEKKSEIKQ